MTLQRYEAGPAENVPSTVSVRAVFRATRRYWWLILALWTVGSAGLGAAVYLKVRPQYRAYSLLRVDPTAIDLYGAGSREGDGPYMKTHVELIKSPNVLSAAATDPKVLELPRIRQSLDVQQELEKSIQVRIRPDTTLIEVSMISPSADEAAVLVNAVADEFLQLNSTWSSGSRKTQIKQLNEHYQELQKDLQRNREKLQGLATNKDTVIRKASPRVDPADAEKAGEISFTVDIYTKLMSQFHDAQLELTTAEANLEQARRDVEEQTKEAAIGLPPRSTALLERKLRSDPEVLALTRQIQQAQSSLDKTKGLARNAGDPAADRHKKTLAELRAQLRALAERKRFDYQEEPAVPTNDPAAQLKAAEAQVNHWKGRRDVLEKAMNAHRIESIKHEGDQIAIRFLNEEIRVMQEKSILIDRRLEQLNFEQKGDERIRKINNAQPERKAFVDKRFQYMAMAPVGVLGAVLALVVLLEIRSGRVADTDVLASRMRHEVFAIAPLPSARHGIGFEGDKAEQRLARFVQSLDHLRVALCEGGTPGEGRCVMITSATGGEGKTTLSAHLAARCANAGTSTLLIDGDLRRASLGRLLDVPAGMGLGDVLAGSVDLDGGLISVQAGGFHFLSAGTPGIDPSRVLKSTRLAELVGQLRQMYDLVIIDTPPVLPVADALIIGRWADGAVMAARYDASRLPLVERANRQIAAAGIPVLGVVVNGVKGQDQAYGNYAYNYNYPGREQPLNNPADVS